jgi:hypothetical protein
VFWALTPCSPLKISWLLGAACRRALIAFCFTLLYCSDYSSTLKIETTCISETLVDFQRTTRHCILQDGTLHNYRCENLKSRKKSVLTTDHCRGNLILFNAAFENLRNYHPTIESEKWITKRRISQITKRQGAHKADRRRNYFCYIIYVITLFNGRLYNISRTYYLRPLTSSKVTFTD